MHDIDRDKPAEKLIELWRATAQKKGYKLYEPRPGRLLGFARMVIDREGKCPIYPKERPKCPCDKLDEDIKEKGFCKAMIFLDPNLRF